MHLLLLNPGLSRGRGWARLPTIPEVLIARVSPRALVAALLVLLSACATSRPAPQADAPASPAQQSLRRFVDAHFEEQFRRFPWPPRPGGLHTYDDQLAGFTAGEQLAWAAFLKQELATLPQQVDRARLPPLDRADYDIFESNLKAASWRSRRCAAGSATPTPT